MRKIMLTVFKHNEAGRRFFLDRLGYETDETSPDDDVHQQFDYAIVSKFNKRKIAMEKKREEEEIRARLAMMQVQGKWFLRLTLLLGLLLSSYL